MTDEQQVIPQETIPVPRHISGSQASPILDMMNRLAEKPDVDVSSLERLFALHIQLTERESETSFNRNLAFAQNEIQNVVVNRTNSHTSSAFADIAALHAGAKPVWTKYGFAVLSFAQPCETVGQIEIVCQVRHADGHKVEFKDNWPIDDKSTTDKKTKTDLQGKGSTLTYARRYMELAVFDVAISRFDKDGNKPNLEVAEQSDAVKDKLARLKGVKPETTSSTTEETKPT